jgi:hypothetical protein
VQNAVDVLVLRVWLLEEAYNLLHNEVENDHFPDRKVERCLLRWLLLLVHLLDRLWLLCLTHGSSLGKIENLI